MPCITSVFNFILFADDTTGIYNSKSLDELFSTVNAEIDKLQAWFTANRLLLNTTKTNAVLFKTKQKQQYLNLSGNHQISINSIPIKLSNEVKFLGLLLDEAY